MDSHRRSLLVAGAAWLAAPRVATAATSRRYTIGFLNNGTTYGRSIAIEVLQKELRERGYVEGENLSWELRFADGNTERLPALAKELIAARADLIIAYGTSPSLAAKGATATLPIVSIGSTNPVGTGIVRNLARPEGNVTGIASVGQPTVMKRIELLNGAVPGRRRVGYLMHPSNPATLSSAEIQKELSRIGVEAVIGLPVRSDREVVQAFKTALSERLDSLALANAVLSYSREIARLSLQHKFASVGPFREFVEAGGLMSYGPSLVEAARQGAVYVDRIFKGAKPSDLPFLVTENLELCFNRKTALALGVEIPREMLMRAELVVD